MRTPNSEKNLVDGVIAAAVGAGIAASVAIAMGQSLGTAMGVVAFATLATLVMDKLGVV
ncbi:MAG: hypothetical protein AAF685_15530 [Cyanobacteria bacterium P01_C01_bin.89]